MATTTEFEAQQAEVQFDELSTKLARLNQQLLANEVEASAEVREQVAKLSADVLAADRNAELKRQEADYDKAAEQAFNLTEDKHALIGQVERTRIELAEAIHEAMCGKQKLRIMPPNKTYAKDSFAVDHQPVRFENVQGVGDVKVLQSAVTTPRYLADVLFAPPITRRGGFNPDPTMQDQFTTLTSTSDAPVGVDYYNMMLMQDLWAGSLMDRSVVKICDRPDTKDWIVPTFHTRITSAALTEGGTISESDFGYKRTTFGAWEQGASTSLSNKFELSSQDPEIVAAMWTEMQYSLLDRLNELLTTGTGDDQPHGCYTAASQAFAGGDYGGISSGSFGSDNRNKITVDPDGSDKSFTNLDLFTHAFGRVNGKYRRSSMFGYQAHNEWAMTLVTRTAKEYPSSPMYQWVDFGGEDTANGVLYTHLKRPVYENPWLDKSDGSANKKMFVAGDFSYFWVRTSPFDLFVSDHVKAEQHETYLRLTTYIDSRVPQWSPDAKRQGPLVYGVSG